MFISLPPAIQAFAHHSFAAEFDFQKPVTLKGTVVKWELINPHGWITLDVAGPDGTTKQWMVETSNPKGIVRIKRVSAPEVYRRLFFRPRSPLRQRR